MCNDLRIISIAQTIADLTEAELDDLAEDLVIHYRGHVIRLIEYIEHYRYQRIKNLVRAVRDNG